MPEKHRRGKGGTKKHGRKKICCERYRAEAKRERNKLRRLRRHLNRKTGSKRRKTQQFLHRNDKQAKAALKRLGG